MMMSPLTIVKGDDVTALTPDGIIRCGGVHDPTLGDCERAHEIIPRLFLGLRYGGAVLKWRSKLLSPVDDLFESLITLDFGCHSMTQ
jgi:hypothetical protein